LSSHGRRCLPNQRHGTVDDAAYPREREFRIWLNIPHGALYVIAKSWLENLSQPILEHPSDIGVESVTRAEEALKVGDRRRLLHRELRHQPAGRAHAIRNGNWKNVMHVRGGRGSA
jgi:hypothetical protein